MRRKTIMNRERIALVLHDHAVADAADPREFRAQVVVECRDLAAPDVAVGCEADFSAMTADGGKPQRVEQPVHLGDRPAADERNGAVERSGEGRERVPQRVGNLHLQRRRRDIEQGAVDIQKNCGGMRVDRVWRELVGTWLRRSGRVGGKFAAGRMGLGNHIGHEARLTRSFRLRPFAADAAPRDPPVVSLGNRRRGSCPTEVAIMRAAEVATDPRSP